MSLNEPKAEEKATETPQEPPKKGDSTATFAGAVGAISGILSGALGAGWGGVAVLGLLGLGLPFLIRALIRYFNAKIDARDAENASKDAAETATQIFTQGKEATQTLDELEKADPPKPPVG